MTFENVILFILFQEKAWSFSITNTHLLFFEVTWLNKRNLENSA